MIIMRTLTARKSAVVGPICYLKLQNHVWFTLEMFIFSKWLTYRQSSGDLQGEARKFSWVGFLMPVNPGAALFAERREAGQVGLWGERFVLSLEKRR